jgi:23S rRNA pseudouridine955/2504/2580 synthase
MNDLGEKAPAQVEASRVSFFRVGSEEAGQRIDNFLLRLAKGVPKSHVYRVIRGGEVRVNKKRVLVTYRLEVGDCVRLPPMRTAAVPPPQAVRAAEFPILFEDDQLLVVDKPAGVAVHGGSGVSYGVIEQLRAARPEATFLELVHRLDRETSGILMLAKRRSSLTALHEQIREGAMDKRYLALVLGAWPNARQHIRAPLLKYLQGDGERRVRVDPAGVAAHSVVTLRERLNERALLEVELKTGRTHQIRVHLAHLGFPIAGDDKYGDFAANRELARSAAGPSLKRMFLHAWRLGLRHPASGAALAIEAPLPRACLDYLEALRHAQTV